MWIVARRMFRPAVVVAVMVGTTLFVASLGLSWLIDARQQQAMVLPLYALMWLSAAMWSGVPIAVPIAVVIGSLVVQTHFTYAYEAVLVAARRNRRIRPRHVDDRVTRWKRTVWWSVLVGALCWVQPLIDQFTGTGNLGTALGPARDRAGAGLATGIQVVAGAALAPPFWSPASMRTFLLPDDGISLIGATIVTLLWLVAAGGVAVAGSRAAVPAARATGVASIVAIVAGLVGATRIPISSFGLVPQNYYWAWSLAAFVSIAVAAGICSLPAVVQRLRRGAPRLATRRLGAAVLVAAGLAVWPRYPVASVAADEVEAQRVGRPLREQLVTGDRRRRHR